MGYISCYVALMYGESIGMSRIKGIEIHFRMALTARWIFEDFWRNHISSVF